MVLSEANILNQIHSILYPKLCFGCNARLFRGEHLLCTICRNDMPLTEYNFTQTNMLDTAFIGRLPIEKAASFLFFRQYGMVKNLMHNLKYKRQEEISNFLGKWWGAILKDEGMALEIDVVVPVPIHPKKLKQRGYNQVDGFAQELAKNLNADFLPHALIKTKNSRTQTKKGQFLRWQQIQGLYQYNHTLGHDIQHKRILLVDDVMTTGATLEVCARALLQGAPQSKIYLATMAVVPGLRH